jgi:predicted acetyltransferase
VEYQIEKIAKAQKCTLWEMWVKFSIEWNREWYDLQTKECEFEKPEVKSVIDKYWDNVAFAPYFLKLGGEIVGYAVTKREATFNEIVEFYLKPNVRNGTVALDFATLVTTKPAGVWRVSTVKVNLRAVKFWQKLFDLQTPIKTWATDKRVFWEFETKAQSKTTCRTTPVANIQGRTQERKFQRAFLQRRNRPRA